MFSLALVYLVYFHARFDSVQYKDTYNKSPVIMLIQNHLCTVSVIYLAFISPSLFPPSSPLDRHTQLTQVINALLCLIVFLLCSLFLSFLPGRFFLTLCLCSLSLYLSHLFLLSFTFPVFLAPFSLSFLSLFDGVVDTSHFFFRLDLVTWPLLLGNTCRAYCIFFRLSSVSLQLSRFLSHSRKVGYHRSRHILTLFSHDVLPFSAWPSRSASNQVFNLRIMLHCWSNSSNCASKSILLSSVLFKHTHTQYEYYICHIAYTSYTLQMYTTYILYILQ